MNSNFDWDKIDRLAEVTATFTPRNTYDGRELLPGMEELRGTKLNVCKSFKMEHDDQYPGEWALVNVDGKDVILDRVWIASGDVTVET